MPQVGIPFTFPHNSSVFIRIDDCIGKRICNHGPGVGNNFLYSYNLSTGAFIPHPPSSGGWTTDSFVILKPKGDYLEFVAA